MRPDHQAGRALAIAVVLLLVCGLLWLAGIWKPN